MSKFALWVCLLISSGQVFANDSNPPPRCDGVGSLQSISLTNWESGSLGLWSAATHDITSQSDFDTPDWAVVGNLPSGRSGKAAFVANLLTGDCVSDDKTGALTLTSTSIVIPGNASVPRISVEHWFQTDRRWDGGNFKISVNGSAFNLIPAFAIEVGPYNDKLFPALTNGGSTYNLNPLAGQDAFTSTSEQPSGFWGQSHINLLGIAQPGDSIRLQFDFGIDECGGDIGWYVDEVEFYSCSNEFPPSDTKLTLVKQVVNNNSGSANASDWILSAAGPTPISGTGPNVTSGNGFAAGTYNLSESGGPSGYSASDWSCVGGTQMDGDTITLAMNEIATCTITNNDIAPTLKVFKTVINDDGGLVTDPNEFKLRVDGNIVMHNVVNTYDAGNYNVSEDGLPDYISGIWGGDCNSNGTITLMPGDKATCTITNDDEDLSDVLFRDSFE